MEICWVMSVAQRCFYVDVIAHWLYSNGAVQNYMKQHHTQNKKGWI